MSPANSFTPGPDHPTNQIYQYSVIAALMTGLSSHSTSCPVAMLLHHGNLGLGTFTSMDGEMVVLDGHAYQLKSDGSAAPVDPDIARCPFAAVTRFEPQEKRRGKIGSKEDLLQQLTALLPDARNHFVSIHVKGRFGHVKCRSVPPQEYEGEPLTKVGERQVVKEYEHVEGTIVGFRSPQWADGVTVAGLHVHFLDKSRKFGGHVLAVSAEEEVELQVALCVDVRLELPKSHEFGARDLEDDAEGLKKVEG